MIVGAVMAVTVLYTVMPVVGTKTLQGVFILLGNIIIVVRY